MAEKTLDRRARMTRKLLKESLIEIMKDKSIHTISIKEICEKADINRSTFYHHYDSQYALYDEIISDISEDFGKIVERESTKTSKSFDIINGVLEYVEKKRDLFLVILSDKSNLNIGESFTKSIGKFISSDSNSELSAYCIQFIAAGMTNIIWLWLNNEERRCARDVALVINTLMLHGLSRAIDMSN